MVFTVDVSLMSINFVLNYMRLSRNFGETDVSAPKALPFLCPCVTSIYSHMEIVMRMESELMNFQHRVLTYLAIH